MVDSLKAFWRWISYDLWHGSAVTAYSEKRVLDLFSPRLEIGRLRIPSWLIYFLVGLIILALLLVFVFKVNIINQEKLQSDPGLISIAGSCFANDVSGRLFVAVDCVWRQYLLGVAKMLLWPIVPVILIFAVGFFTGASWMKGRLENG